MLVGGWVGESPCTTLSACVECPGYSTWTNAGLMWCAHIGSLGGSRRRKCPLRREHSIEAWLHRGGAMMPPTASQWRPAMVSRWLRLEKLIRCGNCCVRETTIHVSYFAVHKLLETSPSTCFPPPHTFRRQPRCKIPVNPRVFRYVFHKQLECAHQDFVRSRFASHQGYARKGFNCLGVSICPARP